MDPHSPSSIQLRLLQSVRGVMQSATAPEQLEWAAVCVGRIGPHAAAHLHEQMSHGRPALDSDLVQVSPSSVSSFERLFFGKTMIIEDFPGDLLAWWATNARLGA